MATTTSATCVGLTKTTGLMLLALFWSRTSDVAEAVPLTVVPSMVKAMLREKDCPAAKSTPPKVAWPFTVLYTPLLESVTPVSPAGS